jgi:hypothetical protein
VHRIRVPWRLIYKKETSWSASFQYREQHEAWSLSPVRFYSPASAIHVPWDIPWGAVLRGETIYARQQLALRDEGSRIYRCPAVDPPHQHLRRPSIRWSRRRATWKRGWVPDDTQHQCVTHHARCPRVGCGGDSGHRADGPLLLKVPVGCAKSTTCLAIYMYFAYSYICWNKKCLSNRTCKSVFILDWRRELCILDCSSPTFISPHVRLMDM